MRRVLTGLTLAAAATATPAAAAVRYDAYVVVNPTQCSLATSNDPTHRAVSQDPDLQVGLIAGPILVDPAQPVSVSCRVKVNYHLNDDSFVDAERSGGAGFVAGVSYPAPIRDDVYLCTVITVDGVTYYVDDSDIEPGNQCARATYIHDPRF